MSYIQEQHLIQNLDHFHVMMHLFNKYTNILPRPEFILELLGKKNDGDARKKVIAHPIDKRIRRIFVEPADNNPGNVKEFTVTYTQKALYFTDCIKQFGQYWINFYPDNMLSEFSFSDFRSIYIEKVCFRIKGKFSENEDGSINFINAHNFDRTTIERKDMAFSSFTICFKQMGA
ncbi:MAG: hypothetical protein AAF502_21010 [Bacteroidota bacterium]